MKGRMVILGFLTEILFWDLEEAGRENLPAFFIYFDLKLKFLKRHTPKTALKKVADKTLNRSGIPKYADGTIPTPIAPISINSKEHSAHFAKETYRLSRKPPMIIKISEITEKITTKKVTKYVCIISWKVPA